MHKNKKNIREWVARIVNTYHPAQPKTTMVKNGAYANRLNRTYLKKDLEQLVYGSIEDYM